MRSDLDMRVAELVRFGNLDELIELGNELSDAGHHLDAERCFRAGVLLGSTDAQFNLGNELLIQERWREAATELQAALHAGVTAAALNLGHALSALGDFDGASEAYRAGAAAGDGGAMLALALELRDSGQAVPALDLAVRAAGSGYDLARSVVASWKWDATSDLALEPELREGADVWGPTRAALAHLLRSTGRVDEARTVLELGAGAGQMECWLPLGNLLWDAYDDLQGARSAYVEGTRAGDNFCHHNLGALLEALGDDSGARREYERGAEGGDEMALRALGELGGEPE